MQAAAPVRRGRRRGYRVKAGHHAAQGRIQGRLARRAVAKAQDLAGQDAGLGGNALGLPAGQDGLFNPGLA